MAKLPTTLGERSLPTPQRRVWSVDNTAMARAQSRTAQMTEASGRDLILAAEARERDQEKDAMLDAVRRDNEAQKQVNDLLYGDGTEANPGLYSAQGANALNSQTVFQERYKTIKEKAMEGLSNPVAQAALEKSLMSMETGTLGNIQRFVQEQRKGYSVDLLNARADMARSRVGLEYNNQDTLTSALTEARSSAVAMAKIKGYQEGDEAWNTLVNTQEAAVYETQIGALINSETPANQIRGVALFDQYKKEGKIKSFDTVKRLDALAGQVRPKVEAMQAYQQMPSIAANDPIGFVMQDLEGGDKYVSDGAGMAKFGLNSVANPDLDIANLDEAGARAAYKERYWKANKIDELPQNMQLLAFDTAVNHRTEFKDEVIKAIKGGASVDDVFIMRLNEYERLARDTKDPKKRAQYQAALPGWKNRLKKLSERIYSTQPGGVSTVINPSDAQTVAANLRPEAQKEFMSLVDNHNKQVNSLVLANRKSIVDRALPAMQTGGFSALPVELRAEAEDAGLLGDLANYSGATDKDMANYLYSLDPATLAETDLDDPAIRLKLSPRDHQRWSAKKEAMGVASNLVTEEKRKKLVSEAFLKRNISTKTDVGKNQALRLNEMLDLEIDAFTSANNGRYPNQAELTQIVDGLFIKGDFDTSWWWFAGGGNDYVFDIEVDELPKSDRQQIEEALRQAGVAPTDAAIVKTWVKKNYGQ